MLTGDYRPIDDYALIADGESAALVSRGGSVDWCCLRRIDEGACFARLLDARGGGHWSIEAADGDAEVTRRYVRDTLVLETTLRTPRGEARIYDCMAVSADDPRTPCRRLLRIVEGVRGRTELAVVLHARFDYGAVKPWRLERAPRLYTLSGGDDALIVSGDADLRPDGAHDLAATVTVGSGERVRMCLEAALPHAIDHDPPAPPSPEELDRALRDTCEWWSRWSARAAGLDRDVLRSAIVLKALTNPVTGAIAAAPTTSLPESPEGSLTWDYRYSWVRDSTFSVRSLAEIGYDEEAEAFRRFIERTAAGSAEQLQIVYGIYGRRMLAERELTHLDGYRGARPVRIGNAAAGQLQLDAYGELLESAWRWHNRGHEPDDAYWAFLVDLVDAAAALWREPDCGLWESRDEPCHFVHSKVMCWAALDRGIRLADKLGRHAPVNAWARERDNVRAAVERDGYDADRGVFVQAFGNAKLDAALLLVPRLGFVDYDDERMLRTTDAIRDELACEGGLIRRYPADPGEDREGAFLACSFWLAECLAGQGRCEEARAAFAAVAATANELGLFSEEYDPETGEMLGNFPQGLTHLSHIAAAVAIADAESTTSIHVPS
jgi:GH15 family glucan-1,4-alpha-glucosidase